MPGFGKTEDDDLAPRCHMALGCNNLGAHGAATIENSEMLGRRISAMDIHVGRRVRAARIAQGVSQEELGNAVGVTFQQIQKYEKGVNRIGTGRLHDFAKFLEVPVTYFFDGAGKGPSTAGVSGMSAITEALSTKEGVRIAIALSRISNPALRRRIADVLEAIVQDESEEVRSLSRA
jgi:transcriptional regulator with XRE-family HTH domain